MKPAAFDYHRATSVADAIAALSGVDAKIIAGGQSLVPMMNFRLVQPERLVDINALQELREIREEGDCLVLGALVRHEEARVSPLIARHLPVIPEAMSHVAHLTIRNRGSIGGSLVHADPSAEWALLLTLLDGVVEIQGASRSRRDRAPEFLIAPLVTSVTEEELVIAVRFPKLPPGSGTAFEELSQRAGDFAVASAGALVRLSDGRIAEARLALGGVGDTPVRAVAAESLLAGREPSSDLIQEAARCAIEGLEPNSDLHASAEYRLHVTPALVRRALVRAIGRAEESAS